MLELGNYVIASGHYVQIKELYQDNLMIEYPDRTRVTTEYSNIRFVELGSDVLKKLYDGADPVCRLIKVTDHPLHRKEEFEIDLRGKKFRLHGYLYNDISVWSFINTFTLHYVHQLQNAVSILNPAVELTLYQAP